MSFYSKFALYYEAIFPFSQSVADFLRVYSSPPQKCLDVGCGTGHYAGDLAVSGYCVTGIDLNASMISFAKKHYPDVDFNCMDMRDILQLDTKYDLIYCVGNSGAHLPQKDFNRLVASIRTLLVPDGIWILQLMNWDYVLEKNRVEFPMIIAEGNLRFNRTYTHISTESVQFETSLMLEGESIFEDSTPLYPIKRIDVLSLHTDLGFSLVDHFGNYSKGDFNPAVFSASIYVFSAPA